MGLETPVGLSRSAVELLVATWQQRLQLTHWVVKLDWESLLDPAVDRAMITRDNPYDVATLQLASTWPSWTNRELTLIVVHELVHLVTRDMEEAAEVVEPLLGESGKTLWSARWTHELEAVVDKFATLIVNGWGRA
jgi:hypothetical protein